MPPSSEVRDQVQHEHSYITTNTQKHIPDVPQNVNQQLLPGLHKTAINPQMTIPARRHQPISYTQAAPAISPTTEVTSNYLTRQAESSDVALSFPAFQHLQIDPATCAHMLIQLCPQAYSLAIFSANVYRLQPTPHPAQDVVTMQPKSLNQPKTEIPLQRVCKAYAMAHTFVDWAISHVPNFGGGHMPG